MTRLQATSATLIKPPLVDWRTIWRLRALHQRSLSPQRMGRTGLANLCRNAESIRLHFLSVESKQNSMSNSRKSPLMSFLKAKLGTWADGSPSSE